MKNDNTTINFSINSWQHLYSLKAAIERKQQAAGSTLTIQGVIRNTPLTEHQDTPILITFNKARGIPTYQTDSSGKIILGKLHYQNQCLTTELAIDDEIFNELKKNLLEYGEIDGIHIVVSLELESEARINSNQEINILDLKYAMKGDA